MSVNTAAKDRVLTAPGALAVPAVAWIYTQAVLSLFALRLPPGSKRWFEFGGTFPDEKRNMLVKNVLAMRELDWVYFSDSDHVVPPDTVSRLLETGCDVVSALYYGHFGRSCDASGEQQMAHAPEAGASRGRETEVLPRLRKAIDVGTLCEVDWVGAGALLVRRSVLERVEPPWFFRDAQGGEDEDVRFCEKVRGAGFRVHVHAGVRVGHLQAVPIGLEGS